MSYEDLKFGDFLAGSHLGRLNTSLVLDEDMRLFYFLTISVTTASGLMKITLGVRSPAPRQGFSPPRFLRKLTL